MKTILMVDDDEDQLFGIETYIKNFYGEKYKVLTANSGKKCLSILEKEQLIPDLIILDVMMPGMNGYEVLSTIRSNRYYDEVPIIFLSAVKDEIQKELGYEIGDDFLEKPIDMEKLMNKINEYLN